jgi:hypothetical protein
MNTELLQDEFKGVGEVSDYRFRKVFTNPAAYVFEITNADTMVIHYETIRRRAVAKCLDFQEKIFSDTELVEKYPKQTKFGVEGFTYVNPEDAYQKAEVLLEKSLREKEEEK